jgi:hypothetical protein
VSEASEHIQYFEASQILWAPVFTGRRIPCVEEGEIGLDDEARFLRGNLLPGKKGKREKCWEVISRPDAEM